MHTIAAVALAFFLIVVGIGHFVFTGYFRTLIPAWIPWKTPLVLASGVAEILSGALTLVPGTRAAGAWAAAALITSYLVSHLDALRHAHPGRSRVLERPSGAVARLVVNAFYIAWAVMVAAG
ncbi:hypothetical protein [Streptosporangium sp. NPDC000396]|uniref:DoxX family protein n=1 Tax=Streptosporangium sp. NPDC000396 TaxID=3366185 RepID=UPI0036B6ED29